jgi:hypothetical protein
MWGGRPRPQPTPSSAFVSDVLAEPDRGSGADEGVHPTSIYRTNHWDRRLDVGWIATFDAGFDEIRGIRRMKLS